MKKASFWIMVVVTILCAIGEATGLQLLPLALASGLIGFDVYGKKDMRVAILVTSILMVLINLSLLSWIDVALWVFIAIVFSKK